MKSAFKKCSCCNHAWGSLIDLVRDDQVDVIGYQASFNDRYEALFFFSHNVEECGTTIALPATLFTPLYDGPEYTLNKAFTKECSGLCQTFFDFSECSNECSMRWVRDIIQMLKTRVPDELLARLEEVEFQQRCA